MRRHTITVVFASACLAAYGQEQQRHPEDPQQSTVGAGVAQVAGPTPGQTERTPAFDAVSVKALGPPAPGAFISIGLRSTPGRISGAQQIHNLVADAYSLKQNQLVLPDIADIRVNMYQIDAVMAPMTTPEQANLMLRTVLVERFGLQFHREIRETPVYFLTVGSKPKLESVDPEKIKDHLFETPIGPVKGCTGAISGSGSYRANCATMYEFGMAMGSRLDRLVIDQTGLPGKYAIDLRWDPADPFDLVSTIQRQLGLKLEKGKTPLEMFVVDHIDLTPTSNWPD
jgi:uncharacterized protein (TIGR03435 family)